MEQKNRHMNRVIFWFRILNSLLTFYQFFNNLTIIFCLYEKLFAI